MCGRADDDLGPAGWEVVRHLFRVVVDDTGVPRLEVRPTDPLRFVRRQPGGFELIAGRWGLVPPGMTLAEAKNYATFNARVESLEEKPMFRQAFGAQRCVIPLAAFWEWPTSGGEKVKVRIARRDAKPLLVAGLWSVTDTPDGPLESCTVVTRPPTPDLLDVHHRMPALLLSKDISAWLTAPPHRAREIALSSWQPRILKVVPA
ncbi:putative SOS response-associated peptidase YedK [Deinococcus metalli]|uniref:Abasic site processing protein n=1 Tax=Deinococcus metalli TaxID=1141878 RepID=A0A7W8NT56_9DEIO|nr:SOS response-associated peptidase [Deinococcus metalli]MBB5378723.1 putative SOS response-associated peptidase YedK [Deinococcus metalli]GHF60416.1 DUF159 family protein [Deinococcus metalli]